MTYKQYTLKLVLRILLLVIALYFCVDFFKNTQFLYAGVSFLIALLISYNGYKFIIRRFQIMDDFFEAVKYRDFSRWFPEDIGPKDIRYLYKGFNEVNKTIKDINSKTEAQFVYLQKILEMVDVGIIAYNLETGDVLWSNESFNTILNFPSFKNISFIQNRKPEFYDTLFDTYNPIAKSVSIATNMETLKVLVSDTVFKIEEDTFKLVVIQNIDNTLDENESEAWKKLLSVMTHEIMNSIAPISSLAETLQKQLELTQSDPKKHPLQIEDVSSGITTIKKRSEGLLKFAKTYRSLNKVTQLNLKKVSVHELFKTIKLLMLPSIKNKGISIHFEITEGVTDIVIDSYLIEQVLINLILNGMDACLSSEQAQLKIIANKNNLKQTIISVLDNGNGIPDEILDKIFIPFFSTKKKGSGIGLSLCKQIMLLHKGKIQIQSEAKKGTAMHLIFKQN